MITLMEFSKKSGISFATLKNYIENNLIQARKVRLGKTWRYLLDPSLVQMAQSLKAQRMQATKDRFTEMKRNSPRQSFYRTVPQGGITNQNVLKWLYSLSPREFKDFQAQYKKLMDFRNEIGV